MTLILVLYWLAAILLVYLYVGYPLALWVTRPGRRAPAPSGPAPAVTLFISAYNEAGVIGEKIRNSLALDYPPDRLQIAVASDGSSDATVEIARSFRDPRVAVHAAESRGGKNAAINRFLPACGGEIVVFTDANALLAPDSVALLVRHFADPTVGLVVGRLRYVEQETQVAKGEGLYFRYEAWMKSLEGAHGTVVAATGSIYAIRSSDFRPLATDVANDLVHPIQIASAGKRLLYEPGAVATEQATQVAGEEFRRRARIVTRGMTACLNYWVPYRMWRGKWGFCFVSHKLLRWFTGLLLAALLVLNVPLAVRWPLYRAPLAAQAALYGLALAGAFVRRRAGGLIAAPFYFTMVQAAALVGVTRCFFGRRERLWTTAKSTRDPAAG